MAGVEQSQYAGGPASDSVFTVTLESGDGVDVKVVREVIRETYELLRQLERGITGERPKAEWEWAQLEVPVGLAASANGLSAATLDEIVGVAQEGFERASRAADAAAIEWPTEFNERARSHAERILQMLAQLSGITVQASGRQPTTIRRAMVSAQVVEALPLRRARSSVEGVLRMLASTGSVIRARIEERGTGRSVKLTLDGSWHDEVRTLWDQRVLVAGRVAYRADGTAVSVADVTRIQPRGGRSIHEFAGAVTSLSDKEAPEDTLTPTADD